MVSKYTISILGGTGKEGKGLAYRWVKSGHRVIIGSRKYEKADDAANSVKEMLASDKDKIIGLENREAAEKGDVLVLTVPYKAHKVMLDDLKDVINDKILIDVTVPLVPPKVTKVQMPEAGSASIEAQNILGEKASVVAAFQNISYENLLDDNDVDCDVLVCGNKKDAREVVLGLVKDAGLVGWDAGVLDNAMVVEGLTSILIGLNKKYGVKASGIRITGIDRE